MSIVNYVNCLLHTLCMLHSPQKLYFISMWKTCGSSIRGRKSSRFVNKKAVSFHTASFSYSVFSAGQVSDLLELLGSLLAEICVVGIPSGVDA